MTPEIIDAQIHIWQEPPDRQWPRRLLGIDDRWPIESALIAMETLGIDACIVDSVHTRHLSDGGTEHDNSYAEEVATRFPENVAAVIWLRPQAPDIEELVASVPNRPGVLGIRIGIRSAKEVAQFGQGEYEPLLRAAEQYDVAVMSLMLGHLDSAHEIAARHPSLRLIIDHVGLPQPPWQVDDPPFRRLPELLALAKFPNVVIKLCGAPAYSLQPYPFTDIWTNLHKVVNAFGPSRLMWAADEMRFRGLYTYSELLDYLRYTPELSDSDKAMILGGTVRRYLRWPKRDSGPLPKRGWLFANEKPAWFK